MAQAAFLPKSVHMYVNMCLRNRPLRGTKGTCSTWQFSHLATWHCMWKINEVCRTIDCRSASASVTASLLLRFWFQPTILVFLLFAVAVREKWSEALCTSRTKGLAAKCFAADCRPHCRSAVKRCQGLHPTGQSPRQVKGFQLISA